MSLIVIGLNHKTADIEIREKLSVDESRLDDLISHLNAEQYISSSVVISTCNRSEFYLNTDSIDSSLNSICAWFGVNSEDFSQHIYKLSDQDAVNHLYKVTAGIDSLVLGETQITGQVKTAYEIANQNQKLSKKLDRLFQNAFRVAKLIRSHTDIGKNPVSVAHSAVQLSQQIFGQLSKQSVLVIGAGSTSELVTRYLNKHSTKQLTICNRTEANGKELAQELNTDFFALKDLSNHFFKYDLIFTATSSPEAIIKNTMVADALQIRNQKPIVIIDLAIPRDTEAEVNQHNDVFYYTVDDLNKVITENLKSREKAAQTANSIIESEVDVFAKWLKAQEHKQLINDYKQKSLNIKETATQTAIANIANGQNVEEAIANLATSLTNKLNHIPIKAISDVIQAGDLKQINYYKDLIQPTKESKGSKNDT